jgi:D-alanyl-D-alanine carboxypeptidase
LNTLVSALKKAGIKKINGRVIGDNGIFNGQSIPDGWIWQDLGTYYGAGITGLCWRENFKSELVNASAGYRRQMLMPYLPVGSQDHVPAGQLRCH